MDDSSSTHLFFNPYPVCRSSTVGTNLVFTSSNMTTGNQGLRTTTMSIANNRRIPLPPPSSLPFFTSSEELMFDDEYYYDEQLPEKKRRLSPDQVNMLEKNFEAENKLEPERKTELAKKLGLQPRQVAVWFQNRRARWKTKQLERDYDLLKNSYDSLLLNYDSILKENDQLKSQVLRLTDKLQALPPDEESPTSATNKDADNHDVGLLYAASVASVHQLCTKPEEGLSSGTGSSTATATATATGVTGGSGGVNMQQLVDSTGDSYFHSDEDYYPPPPIHKLCTKPEEGLSSGTGSSTATATATGVTGGSGGVSMQQLVDSTGDSYFHSDEDYYPPPPMLGLGVGVTHLTDDAIPSEEDDDTGNNCREDLLLLQWFHGTTCQQEYYS